MKTAIHGLLGAVLGLAIFALILVVGLLLHASHQMAAMNANSGLSAASGSVDFNPLFPLGLGFAGAAGGVLLARWRNRSR